MIDDHAKLFNSLRASTAAMLGYSDADHLTAAQEIRCQRAIALRLVIDDAQAKQMRGETIDVRAFTDASENLERMVPGGNPETPGGGHDFEGAKAELEALLAGRAEAIKRRAERLAATEAATMADIYRREEMAAVAAALPDVGKGLPKSDTGSGSKSGLADNVVSIGTANAERELQRLASKEIAPRPAAERAAAEKAWRDSYGGGGVIVPCWSPPNDGR